MSSKPITVFEYISGKNRLIPNMCPTCPRYTEKEPDDVQDWQKGPYCRIHASNVEKTDTIMQVFNLRQIDTNDPYIRKVESCEYQAKEPFYVDYEAKNALLRTYQTNHTMEGENLMLKEQRERFPEFCKAVETIIEREGMPKVESLLGVSGGTIRRWLSQKQEPVSSSYDNHESVILNYASKLSAADPVGPEQTNQEDAGGQEGESSKQPQIPTDGYVLVPLSQIDPNPFNPRTYFDPEKMEELKKSISEVGLIHKPLARVVDGRYQLIVGHRRRLAYEQLGRTEMPLEIRNEMDDAQVALLAITENFQRDNVNPIENARAIQTLVHGMKLRQQDVADKLGVTQGYVAQALSLLRLAEPIQELIVKGELSPSIGRTIASLDVQYQNIISLDELKRMTVKQVDMNTKFIHTVVKLIEDKEIVSDDPMNMKLIKFFLQRNLILINESIKNQLYLAQYGEIGGLSFAYDLPEKFPNQAIYQALALQCRQSSPTRTVSVVFKKISNMSEVLNSFIDEHCDREALEKAIKQIPQSKQMTIDNPEPKPKMTKEEREKQKEERERQKEEAIQKSPIDVINAGSGTTMFERLMQTIQEHRNPTHDLTQRCYNCVFWNPEGKDYRSRCKNETHREIHQFDRYNASNMDLYHCYYYEPNAETIEKSKASGMDIESAMFELLLNQTKDLSRLHRLVPETKGKNHKQVLSYFKTCKDQDKAYILSAMSQALNFNGYDNKSELYVLKPDGQRVNVTKKDIIGSGDI